MTSLVKTLTMIPNLLQTKERNASTDGADTIAYKSVGGIIQYLTHGTIAHYIAVHVVA